MRCGCLQESEAKDELIDMLTKENDALQAALQKLDNMAGDKGRLEDLQQQDDTLRDIPEAWLPFFKGTGPVPPGFDPL